jgi:hypothetical protein
LANENQLPDVLRRALDANVQYLTTASKLALEFLDAVLGSVKTFSSQEKASSSFRTSDDATVPKTPVPQGPSGPTIVLEAERGGHALGVFLVENVLPHAVSARIAVSPFADPSGREVHPPIRLEPEMITLEPQEQILVRVLAGIDESVAPGIDYRAEINVPDLPGTRVPLVLRRRKAPKPGPSSRAKKAAAASKARTKARGRNADLSTGRSSRKTRAR